MREGDAQPYLYTLYSGWTYSYATLSNGRRQIFAFHIPGDCLLPEGLALGGVPLPLSVKSLTAVTLCAFENADIDQLIRANPQRERSAEAIQRYMAAIYRRMADIGQRSAMGRMAQLLLELNERLRQRGLVHADGFAFPPRQEHLADALGLTKVYVNRTLDRLRRNGIIAFDRNSLTILDKTHLQEIAQEE